MAIPTWCTPLAAICALAVLATPGHAQTTPTASVEALHQAIAAADRAAVIAALAPDVLIFESGYVERSRDEYLSHHFAADAKFAAAVKRKVIRQGEQVAGDMALVTAETESSGTYEGKPVNVIGIETAVLRRVDGAWRIVHLHWSSRKAAP